MQDAVWFSTSEVYIACYLHCQKNTRLYYAEIKGGKVKMAMLDWEKCLIKYSMINSCWHFREWGSASNIVM